MSEPSEEIKNQIDEMVKEVCEDSEEQWGQVMCMLAMEATHYKTLAKLRGSAAAVKGYVGQMLNPPPMVEEPAPAARTEDEAQMLLNQCRDKWGTEMKRFESAGIVSKTVQEGMKRSTCGLWSGGSAAAAIFMKTSAEAASRAAAYGFFADVSTVLAVSTASSGSPVVGLGLLDFANSLRASSAAENQLARNLAKSGQICKYASRATVVLAVGLLGYECYKHIRQYWKGEIDGYQCAENLTSSIFSTAAGFAGGAAAVTLCAGAGPPGLIFAGIAGGLLASLGTAALVKGAFYGMFGSDRQRALLTASEVLGLSVDATDEEVRSAYLAKAKETHPDKGGDQKEFVRVNSAYELIRASRLS